VSFVLGEFRPLRRSTIFWPAPKYGKNAPTQKRRWLDTNHSKSQNHSESALTSPLSPWRLISSHFGLSASHYLRATINCRTSIYVIANTHPRLWRTIDRHWLVAGNIALKEACVESKKRASTARVVAADSEGRAEARRRHMSGRFWFIFPSENERKTHVATCGIPLNQAFTLLSVTKSKKAILPNSFFNTIIPF
jgi:hypothetical protein